MLRLNSGKYSEGDDATLVDVLYHSDNFIVINKRYDLKVNSDDTNEVTVASALSRLYPALVDEHAFHGFRYELNVSCGKSQWVHCLDQSLKRLTNSVILAHSSV